MTAIDVIYDAAQTAERREQRIYQTVQKCLTDQVACAGSEVITVEQIRGWIDLAVVMLDELEKSK